MFRPIKWLLLILFTAQVNAADKLEIDPIQLEAFMDGVWLSQKASKDVMGAVVTVVKDNQILLNKGYGFADYDNRVKVNADKTLFRIASISKPFTWTAVMQLVEQGKLDLNENVNTYLTEFQIPDTFPEPITMKHLMTHSAGFEDVVLNLGRCSADELLPLGTYLKDNLPRRVRPVGTYSSYSNHSTAIAAHVIEAITGMTWSDYIEQQVLAPLNMERTVARHPVPTDLLPDLSKNFDRKGGKWTHQDFLYWNIYPAGMMSTTGQDMANFMMAHLNEGTFNGASVLKPDTTRQMQSKLFSSMDDGNDWLHGFYESSRNGVKIFGHGGDLNAFHSNLLLFPEHNLGLFVSFNSEAGASARSALSSAFIHQYFPVEDDIRPAPPEDAKSRYADFEGTYGFLRRNMTDFSQLVLLVTNLQVSVTSKGYLSLTSGGAPTHYVEVNDDRFRSMDNESEILFVRNEAGEVTHMVSSSFAGASWDKLGFTDSPQLHRILFALVAIVSGVYLLYWPIRWIRRKIYRVETTSVSFKPYAVAWIVCLSQLSTSIYLAASLGDEEQFYFGIPDGVITLLYIVLATCLLMPILVGYTLRIWSKTIGSISERINYSLVALIAVLNVYLAWYWNLLSFHFS